MRTPSPRRYQRSLELLGMAAAALVMVSSVPGPVRAGGDWNDGAIAWKSYEAGMAEAKETSKPVCLVFYTEWCPHCQKYSRVFHDPEVVKQSKDFVMIRLDKDRNAELSGKYAADGQYIPRTYFLSADGELQADIHEARAKYKYFYDTSAPGGLLRGMREAHARLSAQAKRTQ